MKAQNITGKFIKFHENMKESDEADIASLQVINY